jgi:hypothetical protein
MRGNSVRGQTVPVNALHRRKTRANAVKRTLLLSACVFTGMLQPVFATGTIVTSATSLSGQINGHASGGYLVESGSLTITNATVYNFRTVGGTGSGGGAALGGAIFVNSGAAVTLSNVTFLGNAAIGGNANPTAATGGVLNGIVTSSGNGANGFNGLTPSDNGFLVGDGNGDGLNGNPAGDGANSTTGFGGKGGNGGGGEDGWSSNPILDNAAGWPRCHG